MTISKAFMFLFFINSNLLKHNSELKHDGDGLNEDPTKTHHLQGTFIFCIRTLPYCFS